MTQAEATFLAAVVAAIAAIIGAWTSWRTASRARRATYDHAVVEKRLEKYGQLVEATSPFAIYFPSKQLDAAQCQSVGEELRKNYFSGTGIIFSPESRDMYMSLVFAVTKAAAATSLNVPTLDSYADSINLEVLADCQTCLGLTQADHRSWHKVIDGWEFGLAAPMDVTARRSDEDRGDHRECRLSPHFVHSIRDYVLLQRLTSLLRTELADDIVSRRRPQ